MTAGMPYEVPQTTRKQVLNLTVGLMLALFAFVIVAVLRAGWQEGAAIDWTKISVQSIAGPVVAVFVLLCAAFVPDKWHQERVNLFLSVPVGYGFFLLWLENGLGYGWEFLFAAAVLAFVLAEEELALTWNVLIVVGIAIIGGGKLYLLSSLENKSVAQAIWLLNSMVFYGILAVVDLTLLLTSRANKRDLSLLAQEVDALQEERDDLARDAQVSEQTYREMERRTVQLTAVNSIMGMITTVLNERELLFRSVRLISKYFDLEYVRIYLADDRWEWLALRAASSEQGTQMMSRGHRWPIKAEGLVGYVAYTGHARIASEENLAALGEWLPGVHSVLALPLSTEDKALGVLELASEKQELFSGKDVPVFQALATQLAFVLTNVRLFQERDQTIQQLREAFGLEVAQGWRKRSVVGYRYTPTGIQPLSKYGHTEIIVDAPRRLENNGIAVPLKYVGRTLGVLKLYRGLDHPWLDVEIGFVEQAIATIVRALENARLLENARRRAERDRIFTEISARLRNSLDLDWIMKRTIQELNRVLGAEVTAIKLQPSSDVDNESSSSTVGSEEMTNV